MGLQPKRQPTVPFALSPLLRAGSVARLAADSASHLHPDPRLDERPDHRQEAHRHQHAGES